MAFFELFAIIYILLCLLFGNYNLCLYNPKKAIPSLYYKSNFLVRKYITKIKHEREFLIQK